MKSTRQKLFRSLTTVAVAAVATVTILPNILSDPPEVHFDYLYASDTVIEYVLSFDNLAEDSDVDILIVTPNGVTVNTMPVESEIVSNTVTGLNAGTRYNIVVKNGNTSIAQRSVTMAKKRLTALRSVEHECRCAVDGTFHFKLDIIDENGYWADFKATLTDAFGNQSVCEFGDSPLAEHTLAVNDAGMRGNKATLRIVCTTTEPTSDGDRTPREFQLYLAEVNI